MLSCFINFIFNSFAISYWIYFVVIERKKKNLKKKLVEILLRFSNLLKTLNILKKKTWASQLKYFRKYSLRKTWLLKCLNGPVSERLLPVSVLTDPKHCWNLHGSAFTPLFIILRHWLPMTRILAIIDRIYNDQFKYNYLKNQKISVEIFLCFWNLYKTLKILRKRNMSLIA